MTKKHAFKVITILLLLFLALSSCATDTPTQIDEPPTHIEEVQAEDQVLDGPYWQEIRFTTVSQDNTKEQSIVIGHASAPDAIIIQEKIGEYEPGTILLTMTYFPENVVGTDSLGFMSSTDDGETWSEILDVKITGAEDQIPVDPSIYQLEDGTLLLFYQDLHESKPGQENYNFYVASSTDGRNYELEQKIFTSQNFAVNPDIVFFNNMWFMYFAIDDGSNEIHLASGDEYTQFSDERDTGMGGIPGAIVTDNTITLYGCGILDMSGIIESQSDDGITFEEAQKTLFGGCAPAPVTLSDGNLAMFSTHSMQRE